MTGGPSELPVERAALIVLDGWGLAEPGPGNAVELADTPVFDELWARFPTTTLALWSRGDKAGRTIPLEALVHGYTQRNARHVGWRDRGVVAPGYRADLNVIDLDALTLSPPAVVHDLPAGGARLVQKARGYRATIKSGEVTFEGGEWTGATPGGLIRGETAL